MDHKEELAKLREKFLLNEVNRDDFIIDAAIHYAALGLFKRTEAMINLLENRDIDDDSLLKLLIIQKKLSHYTSPNRTCTLNMIVKNEESNIYDALTSVDFIMDEIIICDTGSSDKTVELATLFGVTIIHFEWNNNFSDARNHAIKHSHGNHILWLDADDRMTSEDATKLKTLWQETDRSAVLLRVLNSQGNNTFFDFTQVRLFPREQGILFEQAIHEQLMYSLNRNSVPYMKRSDISIIHMGYENHSLHKEKALRNLNLIEEELKLHNENISLTMSKGDSLMVLGRESEAFKAYKEIIDNDENERINRDIFVQAHLNCASYMIKSKVKKYATPLLQKALEIDFTRTEAMLALGKIARENNDYESAHTLLHKAATTIPPSRLTATPVQKIRLEAIYELTDLLIDRGNFEDAATLMTAAIKDYPNVPAFLNLSGKIFLLTQQYAEAAKFYSASLQMCPENNSEAKIGMANIYDAIGDEKTSEEYMAACA